MLRSAINCIAEGVCWITNTYSVDGRNVTRGTERKSISVSWELRIVVYDIGSLSRGR